MLYVVFVPKLAPPAAVYYVLSVAIPPAESKPDGSVNAVPY